MSFDLNDEESSKGEFKSWMQKSLAIARERRKVRYIEAKEQGCHWLLECRDMLDAFDDDAGLYFELFKTRKEVDEKVGKSGGSQKVMGIYDLSLPLREQGSGITAADWETTVVNKYLRIDSAAPSLTTVVNNKCTLNPIDPIKP